MSEQGLRTIVLSQKVLEPVKFKEWAQRYDQAKLKGESKSEELLAMQDEIERDLELLGAVGIEDKLQEEVGVSLNNGRFYHQADESSRNPGLDAYRR